MYVYITIIILIIVYKRLGCQIYNFQESTSLHFCYFVFPLSYYVYIYKNSQCLHEREREKESESGDIPEVTERVTFR